MSASLIIDDFNYVSVFPVDCFCSTTDEKDIPDLVYFREYSSLFRVNLGQFTAMID